MKDPLRYFLDEGFGSIYAYRNDAGKLEGRMRWVKGYKDFSPTFKTVDNTSIISVCGKDYVTDDEFLAKYAVEVLDENAALNIIDKENKNWEVIRNINFVA